MTSKNSVAAQNRFVYYPDHLVRMPGPGASMSEQVISFLTEPVFKGSLRGIFYEYFQDQRPKSLQDESVGAFISRRLGPSIAENIVSAVFHGIYAGDIYQLSARSLMPTQWYHEGWAKSVSYGVLKASSGSVSVMSKRDFLLFNGLKQSMREKNGQPVPGADVITKIAKSSVYTFKKGIGQLATQLEKALKTRLSIKIYRNRPINKLKSIEVDGTQKVYTLSSLSALCLYVGIDARYQQGFKKLYVEEYHV